MFHSLLNLDAPNNGKSLHINLVVISGTCNHIRGHAGPCMAYNSIHIAS